MYKQVLGIIFLLTLVSCTKFSLKLESYEKQCFFEILRAQQKYSIDINPRSAGMYQLEVSNMVQGKWSSVFYKQSKSEFESFNVHKLAPVDSTYSICIRNIDDERMNLAVLIQSGLELMQFELLPDKSDAENLERELSWLQNQKSKLFESLDRTEGLRATSENLSNLMSTKMIGFAIVGLLSIIVVNVLFYRELKKTFKERKLI